MYNTDLVLHTEFNEDFVSLTDCGGRVHSYGTGGIIVSPGFPEKYSSRTYCRWTIKASSPFNDILIYFFAFQTEGTGNEYITFWFANVLAQNSFLWNVDTLFYVIITYSVFQPLCIKSREYIKLSSPNFHHSFIYFISVQKKKSKNLIRSARCPYRNFMQILIPHV